MNKIKSIRLTGDSIFCGYKQFLQNKKTPVYFWKTRSVCLFLIFLISIVFAGCGGGSGGGGGSTTPGNPKTDNMVKGKVVDGYIKNAIVFLDLDGDQEFRNGTEPSATTDKNGNFELNPGSHDPKKYSLVAIIGKDAVDEDTGYGFPEAFKMSTIIGETLISPISTLVRNSAGNGIDKAEADKVATSMLGIETAIDSDYVSKTDTNSKKIHKYAQVIARMQGKLTKKLETLGVKGDDQQIAIITAIVSVLEEVKNTVDGNSTADPDDVADDISPEEKLPDNSTDVKTIVDKEKERRTTTINPVIEWYGLSHFKITEGDSTQDGVFAEISIRTRLKPAEYSVKLVGPGNDTTERTLKYGGTGYKYWKGSNQFWRVEFPALKTGKYKFVLDYKGNTVELATKELKSKINFNNTEPKTRVFIGSDGLVKALYWDRDDSSDVTYQLWVRKKGDNSGIKTDKRRFGPEAWLPGDYSGTKVSGLQFLLAKSDADKFSSVNNTHRYSWRDFTSDDKTVVYTGDTYIAFIKALYRIHSNNNGNLKTELNIQWWAFNAELIKKFAIFHVKDGKQDNTALYSVDATVDVENKKCQFGNLKQSGNNATLTKTNDNVEGESNFTGGDFEELKCIFYDENNRRATDFYLVFDPAKSFTDGNYRVVLYDKNGKDIGSAQKNVSKSKEINVVNPNDIKITEETNGYITFSWPKISGEPRKLYYRVNFRGEISGKSGTFHVDYSPVSGSPDNTTWKIHRNKLFDKFLKERYCNRPESKKSLKIRITAEDHRDNASNAKSYGDYRDFVFNCVKTISGGSGVTADYYGVGHHIFYDGTSDSAKKKQMSLAEIKLKVPGELQKKYTLSLKKPDGTQLTMKTKGETKYCKDEDCWEYETNRSDTTADLLLPGTYQFILTRTADNKTEVIAEKVLKPFIDFKDNTEPALFFSIGSDNFVKEAYAVPSVDTGIYYNRIEIRKKGDQSSMKRGGIVLGVFLDIPSYYRNSNATGLEYSYDITDGEKYEMRSTTRYFKWKPLTSNLSDVYLNYISMYNKREEGNSIISPVFEFDIVNADSVKNISVLDSNGNTLYSADAVISFTKKSCQFTGKTGYVNLNQAQNSNTAVDDNGKNIGCNFETTEDGKKMVNTWMIFSGEDWGGNQRTLQLSDASKAVVKIGKFFKAIGSALPINNIDKLKKTSLANEYFDFSWPLVAGNPFYRLKFKSFGKNGNDKTVYNTSRKKGNSIRFSGEEFRKNIGNKYCAMPDADFGGTKTLRVRISAYTNERSSALDSRSISKFRTVTYDCNAGKPLPSL